MDDLKNTPATQYDQGKLQLELSAFILTDKLKGEEAGDSGFEIQKFRIEEKDNKLFFIATLEGRARNMSDQVCEQLNNTAKSQAMFKKLPRAIWPNLTEQQYIEPEKEFIISTELVSKENSNFIISC